MKNSWVKVSEQLPTVYDISESWKLSKTMLLTTINNDIRIGYYQIMNGHVTWIVSDYTEDTNFITHWQPMELPINQLLDDLRDTQNYTLNT